MGRPESETTSILRETMALDLDAVNMHLIAAGEKAIDGKALSKRRSWIRKKGSGKGQIRKSVAKQSRQARKKSAGRVKPKRKSPPPQSQPREGTFAAFVWSQPYDMEVGELMARAKAAGIKQGQDTQVYRIRSKYPKPPLKRSLIALTNGSAPTKVLSPPQSLPASESLAALRSQFGMIVFRVGMETAIAWIQEDYRHQQDRLAASQPRVD